MTKTGPIRPLLPCDPKSYAAKKLRAETAEKIKKEFLPTVVDPNEQNFVTELFWVPTLDLTQAELSAIVEGQSKTPGCVFFNIDLYDYNMKQIGDEQVIGVASYRKGQPVLLSPFISAESKVIVYATDPCARRGESATRFAASASNRGFEAPFAAEFQSQAAQFSKGFKGVFMHLYAFTSAPEGFDNLDNVLSATATISSRK